MCLFGVEEGGGNMVGWVGGVIGLLTAVSAILLNIWQAMHKNRQERDATTIGQWEQVAERMQKQLDRQDSHIQEQADAILQLHEEHTTCQIDLTDAYGYIDRIYDCCERLHNTCKQADPTMPDLPPKPERKQRPDRSAMEFRMRSLRQRTETLSQQSNAIHTPPHQQENK